MKKSGLNLEPLDMYIEPSQGHALKQMGEVISIRNLLTSFPVLFQIDKLCHCSYKSKVKK